MIFSNFASKFNLYRYAAADEAMMAERAFLRQKAASDAKYFVTVETGTAQGAGTTSSVRLTLQGRKHDGTDCASEEILLARGGTEKEKAKKEGEGEDEDEEGGDGEYGRDAEEEAELYFASGSVDVFEVTLDNIHQLVAVHISADGSGPQPGWQLKRLTAVQANPIPGEKKPVWSAECEPADVWLASDAADGAIARTLMPVSTAPDENGDIPMPRAARAKFVVGVGTADVRDAATTSAATITIEGVSGKLRCSPPKGGCPPDRGEELGFPVGLLLKLNTVDP
jgi:hypothetical protein